MCIRNPSSSICSNLQMGQLWSRSVACVFFSAMLVFVSCFCLPCVQFLYRA